MARLVQEADVLLESYRPGVLDRLGFGADRLADLRSKMFCRRSASRAANFIIRRVCFSD